MYLSSDFFAICTWNLMFITKNNKILSFKENLYFFAVAVIWCPRGHWKVKSKRNILFIRVQFFFSANCTHFLNFSKHFSHQSFFLNFSKFVSQIWLKLHLLINIKSQYKFFFFKLSQEKIGFMINFLFHHNFPLFFFHNLFNFLV